MKILQINAVYGTGSTGRMTMELHQYMLSNRIESYVACSQGCDPLDTHQITIGSQLDVKIHSLMGRVTGLQGYFSKAATRRLLREIDGLKPDIVHLGNLHSNYINVNTLLNYLGEHDIPTVIVLHDCWFYTGKCSHYTVDGCCRWKNSCGDCPRLKNDIPSWFFDQTRKMLQDKADGFSKIKKLCVIGVSDWIANEARRSILKNATIIESIHNWIDTDVFKPDYDQANTLRKKLGLEGKKVILGVSNLWSDAKGLDTFLQLSKVLEENETIVLVGNTGETKLPRNIINIPPTKHVEELVGYYTMADVFLQLSPEETFGKVVAEAMACGTPVIAVNSTANPELVSDDTGYICEVGDFDGIKKRIDQVLQASKWQYSMACRSYSELEFNHIVQMEKYVAIYNRLLNKETEVRNGLLY